MTHLQLPVMGEGSSLDDALRTLKAAGRSGLVVVSKDQKAHLVEAADLVTHAKAGHPMVLKDIPGHAVIQIASVEEARLVTAVRIDGNIAQISGLDHATVERLELAVTWYACSATPTHTFSPNEYKLLPFKKGRRVCDVDDSVVS